MLCTDKNTIQFDLLGTLHYLKVFVVVSSENFFIFFLTVHRLIKVLVNVVSPNFDEIWLCVRLKILNPSQP